MIRYNPVITRNWLNSGVVGQMKPSRICRTRRPIIIQGQIPTKLGIPSRHRSRRRCQAQRPDCGRAAGVGRPASRRFNELDALVSGSADGSARHAGGESRIGCAPGRHRGHGDVLRLVEQAARGPGRGRKDAGAQGPAFPRSPLTIFLRKNGTRPGEGGEVVLPGLLPPVDELLSSCASRRREC